MKSLADLPRCLTITNDGKTEREVGVFLIRNASGTVVLDSEGQLVGDVGTGSVIKVTPNVNPDSRAVLCAALGGHEA